MLKRLCLAAAAVLALALGAAETARRDIRPAGFRLDTPRPVMRKRTPDELKKIKAEKEKQYAEGKITLDQLNLIQLRINELALAQGLDVRSIAESPRELGQRMLAAGYRYFAFPADKPKLCNVVMVRRSSYPDKSELFRCYRNFLPPREDAGGGLFVKFAPADDHTLTFFGQAGFSAIIGRWDPELPGVTAWELAETESLPQAFFCKTTTAADGEFRSSWDELAPGEVGYSAIPLYMDKAPAVGRSAALVPHEAAVLFSAVDRAEKHLIGIYGVRVLNERPWKVEDRGETIKMTGQLRLGPRGGTAEIVIRKADGQVLKCIHYR